MVSKVHKHKGLTLVELMVTLAATAILAATVVPGYSNLIQRNELTSAVNEIVAQLHYARSEALKRNVPVTLCPSDNGTACVDTLDWKLSSGARQYIVIVDREPDGQITGSGDALLKRFTLGQASLAISLTGSPTVNYLNFTRKGHMSAVTGSSIQFDLSGATSRCLSTSFTGRTEVSAGTCPG